MQRRQRIHYDYSFIFSSTRSHSTHRSAARIAGRLSRGSDGLEGGRRWPQFNCLIENGLHHLLFGNEAKCSTLRLLYLF